MCQGKKIFSAKEELILYKTISSTKFPVILAKSSQDSNEYIIKAFDNDSYSLSSYIREKQILSSFNHPNIIRYIPSNLFQIDMSSINFIVIEYAPYGDFFNLLVQKNLLNEKLVRSFFHQIIRGLDYLHSQGIAHLDLKLENLLLGKDFQLKIADFDVAQNINDEDLLSQGTENYRAPEIQNGSCKNYEAADIYSAGICLFALIARAFPFLEESNIKDIQSYNKFLQNKKAFWRGIQNLFEDRVFLSKSLKELLNGMFDFDPKSRFNIKQIIKSKWYNEPIYSEKEIQIIIQKVLKC